MLHCALLPLHWNFHMHLAEVMHGLQLTSTDSEHSHASSPIEKLLVLENATDHMWHTVASDYSLGRHTNGIQIATKIRKSII